MIAVLGLDFFFFLVPLNVFTHLKKVLHIVHWHKTLHLSVNAFVA